MQFSTSIVDVRRGQLLDVVPGRKAEEPIRWINAQGQAWRDTVAWATLDLSGPFRSVFNATVPNATQVADPFHVVKLATQKMDECRRRVQNEIFGHRGRKDDPLWKARRLMTIADERLSEEGRTKRTGLLKAGDPRGEVAIAFHAKEAVRELYAHHDPELALQFVEELGFDMDNAEQPLEVRSLGRTLKRWKHQIAAWRLSHVSNGPTEAANNLGQASQACSLRLHLISQLTNQGPALCRQAQLGSARDNHTPLKREEPFFLNLLKVARTIFSLMNGESILTFHLDEEMPKVCSEGQRSMIQWVHLNNPWGVFQMWSDFLVNLLTPHSYLDARSWDHRQR